MRKAPIKVFSGTSTNYLGEKICQSLGVEMGKKNKQYFSDGEFSISYEESIRGVSHLYYSEYISYGRQLNGITFNG